MADYFTVFSFVVPSPEPEAVGWFRKFVGVVESYCDSEAPAASLEDAQAELEMAQAELAANPDDADAAAAVAVAGDVVEFWDALPEPDWMGYDIEVDANGEVWIHSGESGEVSNVVILLSEYLRRFAPNRSIFVEWANTCSRRQVDAFSGGGVAITAEGGEWFLPDQVMCRVTQARFAERESSDTDRAAWVADVAAGSTNLGFGDWLLECAKAAKVLATAA